MPATNRDDSNRQVTILEDTSWERMVSGLVLQVWMIVRPWVVLGLALLAGWISHRAWGRMPMVPWAAAGLTLAGFGLTYYTWVTSRLVGYGRAHSTVTTAAVSAWLLAATITGPGARVTAFLLAVFGGMLAITWDVRAFARRHAVRAAVNPTERLAAWFKDAAAPAGLPGARMVVGAVEPTRAEGTLQLKPGEQVAATAVQAARRLESGMQLPPGALQVSEHEDRADLAQFSLSDPRLIRRGVPWQGPSRPVGATVADGYRIGMWQDGKPVVHTLVGHHLNVMGASGAGKSIGGAWNYAAEMVPRADGALVVADITKGRQTFGPLAPALHRFETGKDGARDLIETLYGTLKDRTEFLADHGLQKWRPGCGLTYLTIWLEETPDIFDALTGKGQDHFLTVVKALRSAGGTLVISLQRSTFEQIPTIVRGQMASMCFGLNDSADCRYGLSERQKEAGVDPASWGINYPGMAVLDAPGIPAGRVAMPLRTFAWGEDADAIAAYAAQFPAAARPVDPITARVTGTAPFAAPLPAGTARPVATLTAPAADDHPALTAGNGDEDQDHDDDKETDVIAEYQATEDPNPDLLPGAGPDDPIEGRPGDQPFDFDQGERMAPEAARDVLTAQIREWQESGLETFAPKDLRDVMTRTGMSRAWVQGRLREYLDDETGPVWRDRTDMSGVYRLRRLEPVPA
jgi:hypothetical protein